MISDEMICGGTINNSNYDAPKEIKSKDIVKMTMDFFIYNYWSFREGGYCHFEIVKDEEGNIYLSDDFDGNNKISVSKEVLIEAQKVIDENGLVKLNGTSEYTSGLPPEYGPQSLTAEYESGEKLHFCINGEPYSKWATDFFKLFGKEYSKNGNDKYMPPKDTLTLTRFDIEFDKDDKHSFYANVTYEDDVARFTRSIYDRKKQDSVDDVIDIDRDVYDKVEEILEANDFVFNNQEQFDTKLESKDSIYLEYQSGRHFKLEKTKNNEERFNKVLDELVNYLDTLFNKKG